MTEEHGKRRYTGNREGKEKKTYRLTKEGKETENRKEGNGTMRDGNKVQYRDELN